MKTPTFTLIAGAIALMLFASSAVAESSKDYAIRGKRAWAAFECASLASVAGDQEKQEKLFTVGLNEGRVFIEALKGGKIKEEDLKSNVPIGMLLLLQGPSPDFMLGRVYENAQENALKKVFRSDGPPQSDDERKSLAELELSRRNCDLITK